jgi:hypothetical protein
MNAAESQATPPVLPSEPAPPRRTGLWWKWLLGAFAFGVLLLVTLALSLNGIARRIARAQIQRITGMKTEIDSLKLSLRPPGVRINGFRLTNTPEFGGSTFLEIPELMVSADRDTARNGQFKLHDLRLNLARVNVVVDKSGRSNLDALQQRTEQERKRHELKRGTNAPAAKAPQEFISIDRFELSLGELHSVDQRDPDATKSLQFNWTSEVMTNIASQNDLAFRLAMLGVTRGATMNGEKITDAISLLSILGYMLKPSGN